MTLFDVYSTILLSKKLKHSIINTCLSVLLLKLVFILGIKTYNDIGCKVFGMAIHYFSLTTVFWLTVTTWYVGVVKLCRTKVLTFYFDRIINCNLFCQEYIQEDER